MGDFVPATRMNLQVFKEKLSGARKGYELLKSKEDVLKMKFREICKEISRIKLDLTSIASTAYFSLSQAEFYAGNFSTSLIETDRTPTIQIKSHVENCTGIQLPTFECIVLNNNEDKLLGLFGGGQKIEHCRDCFVTYLKVIIQLASLQAAFWSLQEEKKITSRRLNAIENIVIPKFENITSYIIRELDELEREEFTRIKMQLKKKDVASKQKLITETQQRKQQQDEEQLQESRLNERSKHLYDSSMTESHTTAENDEPLHTDELEPLLYHYPPLLPRPTTSPSLITFGTHDKDNSNGADNGYDSTSSDDNTVEDNDVEQQQRRGSDDDSRDITTSEEVAVPIPTMNRDSDMKHKSAVDAINE